MDWQEALLITVFRVIKALRLDKRLRLHASLTTHAFTDFFKGFEKAEAVRRIFGEATDEVLHNLRVVFTPLAGYMGVNGSTGHLMVNPHYLQDGDRLDVYLDVIHELVHVRQHLEGRELFDSRYSYAQRPTEVEAYQHTVAEARRLRLSDERICQYLKTPWMSTADLYQLAKALNVQCVATHPPEGKV